MLAEYPEIIAWDRLFDYGKHQVLAEVHAAVKAVRPGLQVGFHIEHVNSFNPIFRATRSYAELAQKADFLKIVVYNNCGGERHVHFIETYAATKAALDAGADGLSLSRKYSEMRLANLAAAGKSARAAQKD